MSTYQNPIVVGVFQREADAKRAVDDLRDAGFAKDQLGFALREGGAVTSNLLNDLTNLGVPQDRAAYYNQQYTAGRAVVSVRADGRERDAANILGNYGATGYNDAQNDYYDATLSRDATAGTYDKTTTTGAYNTTNASTYDNAAYAGNRADATDQDRRSMQLREEQVNVTKNTVTTGEVEIGKRAVTENQRVTDTVRREEARIERDGDARINTNDAVDPNTRGNI